MTVIPSNDRITCKEAAAILGVCTRTVARWAAIGRRRAEDGQPIGEALVGYYDANGRALRGVSFASVEHVRNARAQRAANTAVIAARQASAS